MTRLDLFALDPKSCYNPSIVENSLDFVCGAIIEKSNGV